MAVAFVAALFILVLAICNCGLPNYLPLVDGSTNDRDVLVSNYFSLGLSYTEILSFLSICHGIHLSLQQLKRVLKSRGLCRRKSYSHLPDVICAVDQELSGSGSSIGYRQMHQRLIVDHSLVVNRETVRIILKRLDPEGVSLRSRHAFRPRLYSVKCPNYMWHLNGYDKLKPFGFAVHGVIDGYSRRILWLEVGPSNNDPKVIVIT